LNIQTYIVRLLSDWKKPRDITMLSSSRNRAYWECFISSN